MDEQTSAQRFPSIISARWFLPAATGVAGVLLGGLLGFGIFNANASATETHNREVAAHAQSARAKVFAAAVEACDADTKYAVVSDGGLTLTMDGHGKDDIDLSTYEITGLDSTPMWCVVEALKAPTAVTSHMEQTTSMDGRQSEKWSDMEVSWSYHPDRGMDSVWQIADK